MREIMKNAKWRKQIVVNCRNEIQNQSSGSASCEESMCQKADGIENIEVVEKYRY